MAKGKFDYEEFISFYQKTVEVQKSFSDWIETFLLQEGLKTIDLVKPRTPVDTGRLKAAWKLSKVYRTSKSFIVYLINEMEYASFMEDGFTYHTKKGEGHFEGYHMAEISIQEVVRQMPSEFNAEFQKWLKSIGWL